MGCYGGLNNMGHTSKGLLELQGKAEAGMLCFVAGTKIKTSDGDKNIEDVGVGDEVWSCDTETGETGCKHVTRLSVNEARDIAHVTIDGETIDATATHPFYVEGYGFKPAGQLLAGEKVRMLDGADGETGEVENVTIEHLKEPVKVYNFEVEDWHTYYVAELGVLVHNEGCGPSLWTPTTKKNDLWNKGKLKEHYEKHGIPEFGAKSSKEYSDMAYEFGTRKSNSIIEVIEGSYVYRYEPSTNNIFVGTLKGGKIKSFYKWDGREDDAVIETLKRLGKL